MTEKTSSTATADTAKRHEIYRVPQGFLQSEREHILNSVPALADARDNRRRRQLWWKLALPSAAAIAAVIVTIVLPRQQSPSESGSKTVAEAATYYSLDDASLARPDNVSDNDVFLALY